MKIALAQISSGTSVQQNIAKISDFTRRAAAQNAELVVFPEASMSAFGTDLLAAAEQAEHWQKTLANLAEEHRITIVVGEFEAAGKRVRNVAAVYNPAAARASYTKIHLYDAFGFSESDTVAPGDTPLVLEIAGTKVGFALCYDVRFPKLFAELSRAGAQVIVVPTSWAPGEGKEEQWKILTRARALDSNCFVIAVDQANPTVAGTDADPNSPTGIGFSAAVDPFGHTLIECGEGEELRIIELDLSLAEKVAQSIPVLKNAKLGY